jgi:hypothetical protein
VIEFPSAKIAVSGFINEKACAGVQHRLIHRQLLFE